MIDGLIKGGSFAEMFDLSMDHGEQLIIKPETLQIFHRTRVIVSQTKNQNIYKPPTLNYHKLLHCESKYFWVFLSASIRRTMFETKSRSLKTCTSKQKTRILEKKYHFESKKSVKINTKFMVNEKKTKTRMKHLKALVWCG